MYIASSIERCCLSRLADILLCLDPLILNQDPYWLGVNPTHPVRTADSTPMVDSQQVVLVLMIKTIPEYHSM